MKNTLSAKQQEILDYIRQQVHTKGFPPSIRDICAAVNLSSTSSVHAHLTKLEKLGYIKRDGYKSRTIEIVDNDYHSPEREIVNVPIVGTVTAGQPILAVENIVDYFPVPVELIPNAEVFMLRVSGDSMINAGILDGDEIIVQKQSVAENGDYVVALIDDSATVKTYYKESNYIRLQPENDFMEPFILTDVTILGKVIGVFRLFNR